MAGMEKMKIEADPAKIKSNFKNLINELRFEPAAKYAIYFHEVLTPELSEIINKFFTEETLEISGKEYKMSNKNVKPLIDAYTFITMEVQDIGKEVVLTKKGEALLNEFRKKFEKTL